MNECPTHAKCLDVVCLTCDDKMICTSCMNEHRGHDMTSTADHIRQKMAEIDQELDEKTQWLEKRLANRDKALELLNRLTEDVRRDREEIRRSLGKLRSLKLQSQQIRERNSPETLYRAEEAETFLEEDRSVDLKIAVQPENVEATCREVIQILTKAATRPPVTEFTSSREVARVKDVKCFSIACVDDLIFVATRNDHVIKYRWGESGGKISINEVKRSAKIESGYWIILAAVKTQDRVSLYVYNRGKKRVDRFDPDSHKHLITLNTDTLHRQSWLPNILHGRPWAITAWNDVLVITDNHVIAMFKNDQLVNTIP